MTWMVYSHEAQDDGRCEASECGLPARGLWKPTDPGHAKHGFFLTRACDLDCAIVARDEQEKQRSTRGYPRGRPEREVLRPAPPLEPLDRMRGPGPTRPLAPEWEMIAHAADHLRRTERV